MTKYHIEKNTVQETLLIPLFARKICSEHYPTMFYDEEAERICSMLDYDFASREKLMNSTMGLFGAMEVAQRQYDLAWEVKDYLNTHPEASVINLGCGLDNTFHSVDNGTCRGYNIDFPDVIKVRKELLPDGEREESFAHDLTDHAWMDRIDGTHGAVFFASGVFYYMKKEEVRKLFAALAKKFPGGVIVFDSCNHTGAKMMTKTWLKEAGITDVSAFFSLDDWQEVRLWSPDFRKVSARSYMRGYRDITRHIGLVHRIMTWFCDHVVKMLIIKITFKGER